jgi:hypothetical protein
VDYSTQPAQDALQTLASCLCAAVQASGGPTPCFCGVVPGDGIAADYACNEGCDGGMAWVRLTSAYPSKVLGAQNTEEANCNLMLGLDFEVGILRCISAGDEQGNPPSAEELLAASDQQMTDLQTLRVAMTCCGYGKDMIVGPYTPVGPEGGLVGGFFTIAIQVP